jgi:trimeric autotransporter adhesin
VAGLFDRMGGLPAKNMAVLKNGVWSGIRAGTPSYWENIQCLELLGNTLYVGGRFESINGKNVGFIAKNEQGVWKPVGSGNGNSLGFEVRGLAMQGGIVYATGYFQNAGTNAVTGIVKWDGVKWLPIAPTISGRGEKIAVLGGNIYVSGQFELPGIGFTTLACWSGTEWSLLPEVGAHSIEFLEMLTLGGILYRDGGPTQPQGLQVMGFDGTNWNAVPWSVPGVEDRLATDQTNLFIAKSVYFWNPQTPMGRYDVQVAKWDGTNLEMVGGSIEGLRADALAVSGEQVYLAGRWSTNYYNTVLFRWDGNQWSQIGSFSKQDGFVSSMVVMGRNLYVGGKFDSIAGVPVNNIAQWDGSKWRSLGSGLQDGANGSSLVWSMVGAGGKLYVGGSFGTAGGKESGNFAVWTEGR